jgi:predicted enzyme related to lactoylglutathione lyase
MEKPTIVHFDMPADDPERTRKFYEKLFDWKPGIMQHGGERSFATFADTQPIIYLTILNMYSLAYIDS